METVRPAGHQTRTITSHHRSRSAAVFRLLLLGVLVFTIAAMAGAALAGTPAGSYDRADRITGRTPLPSAAQANPGAAGERRPPGRPSADTSFARSLVYSGAAALALSVAGLVIVGRRRRQW